MLECRNNMRRSRPMFMSCPQEPSLDRCRFVDTGAAAEAFVPIEVATMPTPHNVTPTHHLPQKGSSSNALQSKFPWAE
jgi:hypothetical protein